MKQYYIRIVLAIIICLVGKRTFAYDIAVPNKEGQTLYYNYINDGKELELAYEIKNSFANYRYEAIIIPEEVAYMNRTRKVTRIGDYAFLYSGIKKVTLPKTIKSIGKYAFYECNQLQELIIPDNVETLGKEVFSHCFLNIFVVGKGLKSVEYLASGASLIAEKVIVKDFNAFLNIHYDGKNFFYEGRISKSHSLLYSDENTMITNLVLPQGITKIGESLQCCQSLISVTIPESVKEIDKLAFWGCHKLKSVHMSNNVTVIRKAAFAECPLNDIIWSEKLDSIDNRAFEECHLKDVVLPNRVKFIGTDAFKKCKMHSIIIPPNTKDIRSGAFDCDSLLTVVSKIKSPEEIPVKNVFNKNTLMNATLYVPVGTMAKYKSTEGWKDFVFIEEGIPSVIEKTKANDPIKKKYTNLQGHHSSRPHKGINIEVNSNGTTKKLFVK